MDFVQRIYETCNPIPGGREAPPVSIGHPLIGPIGRWIPGFGKMPGRMELRGMNRRTLDALLRDEERFAKNPRKAMQFALRECGAITTWDGVLNSRANGKADDFCGYKLSQTTVANQWSSFFRSGGTPGAGAPANIPGGTVCNQSVAGAWPIQKPTSPDKKYLINFGVNHLTGTNIVVLIDLLVGAGNISGSTNSVQTINTSALTRYTDGKGVMMILAVTTALGSTGANVTISYTGNDSQGSGRSTGAIAMTGSCITYRLQPVAGGFIIPLQSGDIGVKSIQTLQLSASMTAGVMDIYLFKPLLIMPTLATTTYVERSTPGMLGGLIELQQDGSQNTACLTFLVNTSTTSTGVQTYFIQTCSG